MKYIKKYAVPYNFFFPLERALLALAYASFIMLLLQVKFLNKVWRAFAAVGKLALSNYLLQSIICTVFFYGYAMGYYGRLDQWQLYAFALEVIVVQVALSVIWLRYYHYGPAEWLLRRLSSKRLVMHNKKSPQAENIIATIS